MEMFKGQKSAVAVSLTLLLAACGGGGDDDSRTNTSPVLEEGESIIQTDSGKEVVTREAEGEVKTGGAVNAFSKVSLDGEYENMGELASACVNDSSNYFETDKVLVFGSADTTTQDYELVAGWVESSLEGFLGTLETSWTEYMSERRNIPQFAIDAYVESYANLDSVQNDLPDNYAELSESEQSAIAWETYINADNAQRLELVLEASDYQGYGWTAEEVSHVDKIKVCLHDENEAYFESFYTGVAIAKPSDTIPDGYFELLRTALFQMAQESLTHSVHGNPLPVWFANGQSFYFGGFPQAERSEHQSIDATMYVDAEDTYGLDKELLNEHFILAFRYISNALPVTDRLRVWELLDIIANDPAVYTQQGLPADYAFTPGEQGSLETAAFIKAWDEIGFVDEAGNDLSYSRYKNDYHDLMNATE